MAALPQGSIWLKHAFLLPISDSASSAGNRIRRKRNTSAAYKYTNTSLGGNFAINNYPQFTHYADIRHPGLGRGEDEWMHGMGRFYSEAIDDPKQVIHMTFGVPRFSSWTSFFTNFYDSNAALLANTGRVSDTWYRIGLAGGYIVSLPLQPFIIGFSFLTRVFNFVSKNSPSKWYYFQPAMHSYWSAVNTIANDIAINMGIIPRVFAPGHEEMQDNSDVRRTDTAIDNSWAHEKYPSIFRPGGGIDVMSLARRTERMRYNSQEAIRKISDSSRNAADLKNKMVEYFNSADAKPADTGEFADAQDYFIRYIKSVAPDSNDSLEMDNTFSEWKDLSGVYSFIAASQRDGSQFATFRVNHNGSVNESFSNSVRDSDIAQELNTKVSQGRHAYFNLMGGEITKTIGAFKNALTGFLAGAADSVGLGGLSTLAGTAFIDVPKLWDGSTADLPRANYTIPLPSAYGNKMSRYINLMVPISMLLAGALPLAAGRSAYTSPFICQIYHQGRVQCQLGMIDSLTITRGTGNVGWNAEHDMLGAEVTISVIDLSNLMYVPIKGGFTKGDIFSTILKAGAQAVGDGIAGPQGAAVAGMLADGSVWDEQSTFSDYMAILSSMSLSDMYYVGNRLNLNLTRSVTRFETWRSPANFMSWALDSQPARTLSAFAQFSDRITPPSESP